MKSESLNGWRILIQGHEKAVISLAAKILGKRKFKADYSHGCSARKLLRFPDDYVRRHRK